MLTINIDLPPEIEQKLRERAAGFGKSFDAFLKETVERAAKEETLKEPPPPPMSAEEWIADFQAWAASRPAYPVIVDDSRESFYEGRDG